ncbi:non-ribosomal peptide synthetase [Aspergillus heteromorphus CBS 117.55]|uniref:Non-ribosomal peptide synthetase n=1 Tax=Aspergillus heteromorphus CBS 117.55 TaxID=1448321 RepID=A0A317WEC0_9EURO|nr:non-ribosomal peptide synthetase [Aspergillus heteromorphus CBS 117.55]PWY83572.1 non-ribosomal peptide synthetase [Aspergillus heteromorphus CBS 117.55]
MMNQLIQPTARSRLLFQAAANALDNAGVPLSGVQAFHQAPNLQEEMVLASMNDPNHLAYLETQHFTTGETVQAAELERAAHALALKHAVLRTIFCWSECSDPQASHIAMVVLGSDYLGQTVTFVEENSPLGLESNDIHVRFDVLGSPGSATAGQWRKEMPWKISVASIPDKQGSRVTLSYHQALLDQTSAFRLVRYLQGELSTPGSVQDRSDFFAVHKGQAYRCSRDIQARLQERFSRITSLPFSPDEIALENRFGHGEKIRKVTASLRGDNNHATVPAWMARLALFMSMCTLGKIQDATFFELMSGRELLPSVHQDVLGHVSVPQIRRCHFASNASLYDIAQELNSETDIGHGFSPEQIRSLFPKLDKRHLVCLICHADEPAFTRVGSWIWDGKKSESDIPLTVEIMPLGHESCLVSIRYHRKQFAENTIVALQEFFCGMVEWLQEAHSNLKNHTFAAAVQHVLSVCPQAEDYLNLLTGQSSSGTIDPSQEAYPDMFRNSQMQAMHKSDMCAHHFLEQQAKRIPQKIALQYERSEYMTYRQLDDRCNEVAGALIDWLDGVRTKMPHEEIIIPICFKKGIAMIIAMFAVLKAGAAFVAIDISHPTDRITSILQNTKACVILCGDQNHTVELQEAAERSGALIVTVSELTQTQTQTERKHRTSVSRKVCVSGSSLAFVQTTSGTTGTPKCIMVEHRNLVALMQPKEEESLWAWTTIGLQLANLTFDMAKEDIFMTLSRGGRLTLGPDAEILSRLPEWLEMTSITHLITTPLIADLLESRVPPYLTTIMLGGESFHPSLIGGVPSECRLYNGYGPSETTIVATRYRVSLADQVRSTIPVGSPYGLCRIYILGPGSLEQVAKGEVGEICIGGPQVTRGYLGQSDITAANFIPDPFSGDDDQKMYRTGDLGRFLPEGMLDYLGRIDSQVKVRGQRVETLEIEALIGQHEEVKNCAVVLGESIDGGTLVAFVETKTTCTVVQNAAHNDWSHTMAEIKSHVVNRLPDYMIPGYIIKVDDGLPRLASNKLDRRELASRATKLLAMEIDRSYMPTEYMQPSDEIEKQVCEAFSTVLSCRVGISDNFLNLGGHSVTAIRAASRIRQQIRTNITFRDILECLTPHSLSIRIRQSGGMTGSSSEMPHHSPYGTLEQSFAQGRLWFVEQLHSNLSWYLIPLAFRVRGPLRLDVLEAVFLAIEQRHETLRTTFEERNGVHLQIIHRFVPKKIRLLDIESVAGDREEILRDALRREQTTPFDLSSESGWRPAVIRMNNEDHIVSIVLHHIIADGWSLGILFREVTSLYSAGIRGKDPMTHLPPLPIQYQEYSLWQRQEEQLMEQNRQLEYWTRQLQGSHPAEFICDHPRPPIPSGIADVRELSIGDNLYKELQRFCRRLQVTPFIVLLAAFRAAHYRMTGSVDATIGTPITNRNREEHEGLIGLFVNMQCMRILIPEEESFEQLVLQVKDTAAAAFAHDEVPFENIVSKLQPTRVTSRTPLIQTVFAVHPEHHDGVPLEGLESERINLTHVTRFDLEFHFHQHERGFHGEILFATDLFHHRTIETLVSTFHQILKSGLNEPDTQIENIPLQDGTSALKHMGLIEIQRTDYPRDSSIVDLFRQQVNSTPDATAIKDNSGKWSYSMLDRESEKIADWLTGLDLEAETVIAVLSKRSCEAVAAFLGILKANMAYIPLDVTFPTSRIETIFSSIQGPRIVLLGSEFEPPVIQLDRLDMVPIKRVLHTSIQESREKTERSRPSANSLAFVLFTSGSTGRPKGVMIEHRGVVLRARDSSMFASNDRRKTFAHMASIGFDAAAWEIYNPLLNGGTVLCIDTMTALDHAALSNIFQEENVRTAFMTPAVLKQFVLESPAGIAELDILVLGGDRPDPRDLIKASRLVHKEVVNAYGPTENSFYSTLHRVSGKSQYHTGVPIGKPVHNSGAYVMDRDLRVMQPGVLGELVVVGDGLARGYSDATKNLNRFVSIEIDGQVVRGYRTGDRARYRPADGQLEFIGRLDGQVKVRGFRVETGEIENVLLESGLLDSAAVILQQEDNKDPQLVAFVTRERNMQHATHTHSEQDMTEEHNVEEAWKEIFNATAYETSIGAHHVGRDFSGWKSMYDGADIDKAEMSEWLDDSIATLLNGGPPGHVLEIGTGSGMILFNLTEGLQSYIGFEPVQPLVDFINKTITDLKPSLADKVQLHVGSASDLSSIASNSVQPDLVVVNSVAQYFPNADYLGRLIEDLIRVHRAKTLFFGDIRSYALYSQFQVTKALHACGEMASLSDIRENMAETVESETELLVDPAFFTVLTDQLPDLIHHVEILPKRMGASNELSCYRYSAVIHAVCDDQSQEVHIIDDEQWIDFSARGLDRERLLHLLQQSSDPSVLAISNIPHSKTVLERLIVEALSDPSKSTGVDELLSIRQKSEEVNALSAVDLMDLGALANFRVEISWARHFSQHGGFDAIFHRIEPECNRERTMFRFKTDHKGRSARTFSNNPMQNRSGRSINKRLRQLLKSRLPSYMVPAVIQVIDKMPINHNGKIDRRVLARMATTASSKQTEPASTYAPPRDDMERVVCEEFATVLGSEVGITDSFFNLGGHSLMATRTISSIVKRLKCIITVRDLFDCPTPEALAKKISSIAGEKGPMESESEDIIVFADLPPMKLDGSQEAVEASGLCAEDIEQIMPCTPFQEGVLTTDMVVRESPTYQATMRLEFDGILDFDKMQSAWQSTVEREVMLRTAFLPTTRALHGQGICSGAFLQAVLRNNSEEVVRVATIRGFDAEGHTSPPDLKMGHIPVSLSWVPNKNSDDHELELTIHHALYDEAYLTSILDGLSHDYHRASEGSNEGGCENARVPFTAFVRMLQTKEHSKTSLFWKEYLKDAPTSTWPIPSGLKGPIGGENIAMVRAFEWRGNAGKVSKALGTTPAGMARAAFALTIATHSDSDDITWGEVSSGRSHSGFVAGPCIATHPVRIRLAAKEEQLDNSIPRGRVSVDTLLRRTRDAYLDTIPYQHLGLQPIRQLTGNPDLLPFQVLFVYQESVSRDLNQIKPWGNFRTGDSQMSHAEFPLVLEVSCHNITGHISMRGVFDPFVLPSADVEWILQHVADSLDLIACRAMSEPDGKCSEASLIISDHEKKILEQVSAGGNAVTCEDAEPVPTVVDIFHRHATDAPQKIAIQVERTDYATYQQIDHSSDRVASGLQKLITKHATKTPTQQYIPVFFEKSIDMVTAILAILKAGAAFVPMDVQHPMQRLEAICEATRASIIIWDGINGGEKLRNLAKSTGAILRTVSDLIENESQPFIQRRLALDSLAYVLFTSGSTGVPKGVMVEHRSLASFALSEEGSTDCSWTSNRLALLASTFDASVGDLFATLSKGGRLFFVEQNKLLPRLGYWLEELNITHLALTPTLGALMMKDLQNNQRLSHLHTLVFGGEPFRASLLDQIPKDLTIWNGYGPTETTIEVAACKLQGPGVDMRQGRLYVPIGNSSKDRRIYLLRPGTQEQVPIGSVGEMCIGGPQIARGYLGQPDLTAAQFTHDPFSPTRHGKLYRTGDIARLHGDGQLEYLGRIDGQIKLRGLRIDTNEICSIAQNHPQVMACAVAKVQSNGNETLAAVVEVDRKLAINKDISESDIKEHIAHSVPAYMVPACVWLQTTPLPRTTSGKLDQRAISKMAESKYKEHRENLSTKVHLPVQASPGSEEAKIASLWAKVLGAKEDAIDITATFSQMGGDSIRAIVLLALLRRDGLHFDMTDLSQTSTVQSQAAKLHESKTVNGNPRYLRLHVRPESEAIIVLVHPFLAQSTVFEPLVPLLDESFDIILVNDPFVGTSKCPETLTEWASSYLHDIQTHIQSDRPVFFGGYSFGGLIAFEMALLWDKQCAGNPASVILLDPGTYRAEDVPLENASERDDMIRSSLGMADMGSKDMLPFQEHFNRHVKALRQSHSPPVFQGRSLHLALPDRLHDGVVDWWRAQCSNVTCHVLDCGDHYALLKDNAALGAVSRLINEHCHACIDEARSMGSTSSGFLVDGGSSRTDVSTEDDGDVGAK